MTLVKSVAIHQPNFAPWLGYFFKIAHCDHFVILDNVDFQQGNKDSITSRTKIKCNDEEKYFCISVKNNKESKSIKDIKIDKASTKIAKQIKTIYHNYSKSNHFNEIFPLIEQILIKYMEFEYLAEANTFVIMEFCKILDIKTPFAISSNLNLEREDRNDRIIEICKKLNSAIYFSGQGGKAYHDENLFRNNGIEIKYTNFKSIKYNQIGIDFISGLSIIDALLNEGVDNVKKLIQI